MLFVLIFLFGLGLRLIWINQSLWLDEAISYQAAKISLSNYFIHFAPKDFNPPLYYLVLHFWLKIFPSTEFFLRLPSLIFALLTGVFVYKIYLKIFKDKKGAIFTLVLLLTSPLHIYYSQEVRVYSLAAFLTSASMYYFILLLEKQKKSDIIYYLLFTVLMLYSHYLCWLVISSQIVYVLIHQPKKLKKFFIFHFSFFIFLYLPWLPVLLKQFNIGKTVSKINPAWASLSALSFKNIFLLPVKFIIGRTAFINKHFYFLLSAVLVLFFIFLLWQEMKKFFFQTFFKRSRLSLEGLMWGWLLIPPILGILISLKVPIFSYFRFLFCLPVFYILISKGTFLLKRKGFIIGLLLLINLFFSFRYLFNQRFHRENWKKAIATLHQKNFNQAPILILKNINAPFLYYDKEKSKIIYFQQKELVINENEVWVIPYAQPIFDSQDTARKFLELNGFQRTYEKHFRGVTLEKWQKLLAFKYNEINENRN